jgi:hypothetical protein
MLTQEDQIIERWKQYFQNDQQNIVPRAYYENENPDFPDAIVKELTYEEVSTIIMNFKKMKAPGIDNINAELIQAAGPQMHRRLNGLVMNIWNQERMPNEWSLALICPIYKKGEKSECCNYRRISLFTIVHKILATAINNRLT